MNELLNELYPYAIMITVVICIKIIASAVTKYSRHYRFACDIVKALKIKYYETDPDINEFEPTIWQLKKARRKLHKMLIK